MNNPYINRSISHATMRPEDLLERFVPVLSELRDLNNKYPLNKTIRDANVVRVQLRDMTNDTPLEVRDNINDTASDIVNDLFDELNGFAPEGYYFGSHFGDGSDYGFWEGDGD